MKKFAIIIGFFLFLGKGSSSYAKTKDRLFHRPEIPRFTIGFNVLETAIIYSLSLATTSLKGKGYFLPLHFNGAHYISPYWGFHWGLIYRRDQHSTFINYNEWIVLAGARYSFSGKGLNGFFGSLRTGYGYSAGDFRYMYFNGNSRYQCHALTFQPEWGWSKHFISKKIGFSIGTGVLFIVPVSTRNDFDLSVVGVLIHRIVPVFNFTIELSI